MKIAIVIDSAAGLSKEQVEKLGWYLLPLNIDIEGKNFIDGVEINSTNFFDYYKKESKAKTSAFHLGYAEELFTKLSMEYDSIVVYPISKYLSSAYSMLQVIQSDFPKLKVIESIQVAQLMLFDLLYLENKNIQNEQDLDNVIKSIENGERKQSITLIPKYNDCLVKGGRLHPAAALIAKLLKIVPLIKFENGQLLKESKGLVFAKSVKKMLESKLDFYNNLSDNRCVILLHSQPKELEEFVKYTKEIYHIEPFISYIPTVVSIHTGAEAFVCIVTELDPKIQEKIKTIF
ncbi:DegV family protein [Mycoplasmopsis lipophila]|uniref:DegV family protein n=1 Tax=Mycoplasmopsis lipophila TaxID=2117 RepID=UPI003872B2C5